MAAFTVWIGWFAWIIWTGWTMALCVGDSFGFIATVAGFIVGFGFNKFTRGGTVALPWLFMIGVIVTPEFDRFSWPPIEPSFSFCELMTSVVCFSCACFSGVWFNGVCLNKNCCFCCCNGFGGNCCSRCSVAVFLIACITVTAPLFGWWLFSVLGFCTVLFTFGFDGRIFLIVRPLFLFNLFLMLPLLSWNEIDTKKCMA